MSCGRPHKTPCDEVLRRVHEYLDSELQDNDLVKISEHLEECGPCLREYGIEEAVKALVRRACTVVDTPSDLRSKVLYRIRSIAVEVRYSG